MGVPVAAADGGPRGRGLMGRQDIRIPKLLMTGSPPAVMSFDHVLGSDLLRDLHTAGGFCEAGVELRDNTAGEIRELAIEMMDRIDGVAADDPLDALLQLRFQELVLSRRSPPTWGTMSRIGRHFLRTHEALFENECVLPQKPSRPQASGLTGRRHIGDN